MNWKAVTAILIVVLLVAFGAGLVHDWRVDSDFPAIQAKASESQVRQLMGAPQEVLRSCAAYDTSVAPDCDHVFVYRSVFSPLRSKYWLVFFDKNDRVTATSSQREP